MEKSSKCIVAIIIVLGIAIACMVIASVSIKKTEKNIFNLYLQGKSAKEIADILNIRESTLKFHNHNILEKLSVSSRKQMLRYATLLKQETQSKWHN